MDKELLNKSINLMHSLLDSRHCNDIQELDKKLENAIVKINKLTLMELIIYLRLTFVYKDKLNNWLTLRELTKEIIITNNKDPKIILNGLYEN